MLTWPNLRCAQGIQTAEGWLRKVLATNEGGKQLYTRGMCSDDVACREKSERRNKKQETKGPV